MRHALRTILGAAALVSVLGATACTSSGIAEPSPSASTGSPVTGTALSGASGPGVASGAFARWRGFPVGIAGTWSDDTTSSVELYQLQKGGEYASWAKPLDIAVGAIGKGETWQKAARGAYDKRWITSLTRLKALRSKASGMTYIRFAHEMNGDWYPWRVTNDDYQDFDAAWIRYRALQKRIFPEAKLVFSVNRESVGTGMDWRGFFPGSDYVDVISVDYYNQYPYVDSAASWKSSLDDVDSWGAPKGLDRYRAFAASQGLPLALSEWSGNADDGDSPAFVTSLLDYVAAHAGDGAGRIAYEILFDVPQDGNRWNLYGDGVRMPGSSTAYRAYFTGL